MSGETDVRAKLREHFANRPPDQHAEGWDKLWKSSFTPWDKEKPSPALEDTLEKKQNVLGGPFRPLRDGSQPASRKRALVPGCGAGYDVFLLASYGYDAYGLDVSETALEKAMQLQQDPSLHDKFPLRNAQHGQGKAQFVCGDFFTDGFVSQTGGQPFDLIYDYTFLCAIPPELRPRWAKRMSQLLSPDGHLICLEFPLDKEPKTGGPPHGLTPELYEVLLSHPGKGPKYDENGFARPEQTGGKADDALIRVDRWLAERTHAIGQGTDHVSIWRHFQKSDEH